MENFYQEDKKYLALKDKLVLISYDLAMELTDVVNNAIQFTISKCHDRAIAELRRTK